MADKKFYWLKLQKDFFKRHDIRIIEDMPNGKDYILFYLKMLLESITHEGELRFSETIPYNEQMLATITNTNIDIVRSAMKVFTELQMVEVLEDKTIYMSEVSRMIGSESNSAERVRNHREKQKMLHCNADVTECNENVTQSKSKSIDKDIDKDKDIYINTVVPAKATEHTKRFKPPTVEEVDLFIKEKGYHFEAQAFVDFYESKNWMVGKNKMSKWKSACSTWERNRKPETKSSKEPTLESLTKW